MAVQLKYFTKNSLGGDVFKGDNDRLYVDNDGEIFTASSELYEPIKPTGVRAPSAYHSVGFDDWSRELFKSADEVPLVSVDGYLHKMTDWGEPICSIGIPTPKKEDKDNG